MNPNALLYNLACERRALLEKVLAIIKREIGDQDGTEAMLPLLKVREDVSALRIVAVEDVARLKPRWTGDIKQPPVPHEPDVPIDVCVFCRGHRSDVVGEPCASFLAKHEFHEAPVTPATQVKRVDTKICTKCMLHQKNPASATNGCEHAYPEAS